MAYALLIDDNRQTTEAMVQMLTLWKIATRTALTPSAGMAILSSETPAVVFLDINMPGVDGFEVLGYLRREPRLAKIPVVIVSSDDQPETYARAMKSGANAFIVKPAMLDVLEKTLKNIGII
jgi:PleD family two-component response regulator